MNDIERIPNDARYIYENEKRQLFNNGKAEKMPIVYYFYQYTSKDNMIIMIMLTQYMWMYAAF